MSQWENPPAVVLLTGNEEFRRLRQLREAISAADRTGRAVEYVKGSDRSELVRILSSTGVLFQEDMLVIVEDIEDIDVELVLRHHERGEGTVCLLLHHVGAIKAKSSLNKIVEELTLVRRVAKYDRPKPWEEIEKAQEFCLAEAKRYKLFLTAELVALLVKNVGTDLGMLAFEIEKLSLVMEGVEGSPTAEHVRSIMGAFGEMGPKPVSEAMGLRDGKAVGIAMDDIRRTTHSAQLGGATLRVCSFLGHSASSWLHAASSLRAGRSPEEISTQTGVSLYIVRNNILPCARRWGEAKLLRLLRSLARVERAVKSGQLHPWVQLECVLFRSLRAA